MKTIEDLHILASTLEHEGVRPNKALRIMEAAARKIGTPEANKTVDYFRRNYK